MNASEFSQRKAKTASGLKTKAEHYYREQACQATDDIQSNKLAFKSSNRLHMEPFTEHSCLESTNGPLVKRVEERST